MHNFIIVTIILMRFNLTSYAILYTYHRMLYQPGHSQCPWQTPVIMKETSVHLGVAESEVGGMKVRVWHLMMYMYLCVKVLVCVCVRASMRACVFVCVCVRGYNKL